MGKKEAEAYEVGGIEQCHSPLSLYMYIKCLRIVFSFENNYHLTMLSGLQCQYC